MKNSRPRTSISIYRCDSTAVHGTLESPLSTLRIIFLYHTFLSSLVKEATGIHLPCDSLPRQGRRPLFSPKSLASHKSRQMDLIHVQGSQIRNGAGEDALKRGMD